MRIESRAAYGLALSVAVHAGLLLALVGALDRRAPEAAAGRVMRVALVPPPQRAAASASAPEDAATLQDAPLHVPDAAPGAAPEAAGVPDDAARDDIYYYFPHELERELMVVIDRTGEADIALPREMTLHLFVDLRGKVAGIAFEGEPLAPELEAAVRAAFITMEFTPGMRQGVPVPSRIKIVIAAPPPIDRNVY